MSLSKEQLTELVDIREQFVTRFIERQMTTWEITNDWEGLTDEQIREWRNEGYVEFRRLYPLLNGEFMPHLPEHLVETETDEEMAQLAEAEEQAMKEVNER